MIACILKSGSSKYPKREENFQGGANAPPPSPIETLSGVLYHLGGVCEVVGDDPQDGISAIILGL